MTSNQKMRRKREAKKRKKREANERKRVKIDSESNRPVTSTKSDDAGPSDQSRSVPLPDSSCLDQLPSHTQVVVLTSHMLRE
jgi:hypothetical protein